MKGGFCLCLCFDEQLLEPRGRLDARKRHQHNSRRVFPFRISRTRLYCTASQLIKLSKTAAWGAACHPPSTHEVIHRRKIEAPFSRESLVDIKQPVLYVPVIEPCYTILYVV
jgi:hypothetical protein